MTTALAPALVLLLHGVGSRGPGIRPVADEIETLMPGVTVATPDAPFRFDGGDPGRQWFSISDISDANRSARIEAARAAYDEVLTREIERHGFAGRPDRVAIVGFSQGTIMTLDAVADGRWSPAAFVGIAGRLATAPRPGIAATTPVLLIHGTADAIVPVERSTEAAAALSASGFAVRLETIPGLGHSISQGVVEKTVAFLSAALAA